MFSSSNVSALSHVGEHVSRGIAILLLLPKDKHRRGEYYQTFKVCSSVFSLEFQLVTDREGKVQTQSRNPVYRQTEVSFKQLTDSNQSSVDDMAIIRAHTLHQG